MSKDPKINYPLCVRENCGYLAHWINPSLCDKHHQEVWDCEDFVYEYNKAISLIFKVVRDFQKAFKGN